MQGNTISRLILLYRAALIWTAVPVYVDGFADSSPRKRYRVESPYFRHSIKFPTRTCRLPLSHIYLLPGPPY